MELEVGHGAAEFTRELKLEAVRVIKDRGVSYSGIVFGRDTISHPDRGHDDVANAVAGAAALSKFGGYDPSLYASDRLISPRNHSSKRSRNSSTFLSGPSSVLT